MEVVEGGNSVELVSEELHSVDYQSILSVTWLTVVMKGVVAGSQWYLDCVSLPSVLLQEVLQLSSLEDFLHLEWSLLMMSHCLMSSQKP